MNTITGTDENDYLYGNPWMGGIDDLILAYGGDDRIWARSGRDTVVAGLGNDEAYGDAGEDCLVGGAGDDYLDGGSEADTLLGGEGNDCLLGGTGVDSLIGGTGSDSYFVGEAGDRIVELGAEGDDWVTTTVSFTLPQFVENLILAESNSAAVNGTGNALDNLILGNSQANAISGLAGNDTLAGGRGADTLTGGDGNDLLFGGELENSYIWSELGNVLNGEAGDDILHGSVSTDSLIGGTGDDELYGYEASDTLRGGDGNDLLDGGGSELDYLDGGLGNDTYVLDENNDGITDAGGIDTVSIGFRLAYLMPSNIENVEVDTWADTSVAGNALPNRMVAIGTGDITFDGGDGNDALFGGPGNDVLGGGGGNDVLDGRSPLFSHDTLTGGPGNDVYYVDSGFVWSTRRTDLVNEAIGEGIDVVFSSADFVLSGDVEHLNLIGTARRGTGNDLANRITGNAMANLLEGGGGNDVLLAAEGNDTLYGGLNNAVAWSGVDQLTGGAGNDVFALANKFTRFYDDGIANNQGLGSYALILDFTPGQDRLQLAGAASGYYLGPTGLTVAGTGVWREQGAVDELIAIVRPGNATPLTAANTIATGVFV